MKYHSDRVRVLFDYIPAIKILLVYANASSIRNMELKEASTQSLLFLTRHLNQMNLVPMIIFSHQIYLYYRLINVKGVNYTETLYFRNTSFTVIIVYNTLFFFYIPCFPLGK